MGEYVPLYVALFIIIGVGFIPLLIIGVVGSESVPVYDTGFTGFLVSMLDNSFFGENIRATLVTYVSAFAMIPAVIQVPLIIIVVVSLVYSILKILPTT